MATRHYHVYGGVDGPYDPDMNHGHMTRAEAEHDAEHQADDLRTAGLRVSGGTDTGQRGFLVHDPAGPDATPYRIHIEACHNVWCLIGP